MTRSDGLNIHRTVHGMQVHHAQGDQLIASRGMTLMTSDDAGQSWNRFATLPVSTTVRFGCRFDLYRRLLREGIHAVIPAGDSETGWLVLAHRQVFRVNANGNEITPLWSVQRGRRPLRRGLAVVNGYLFVGDYFANPDRQPVRIYRIEIATGQWEVFHEFPAGTIRHVHLLQHDPRTDRIWVGTGDEDHECYVGTLDPQNSDIQWVGSGSQDWRAVSLALTDEAVYWGTDNHLGNNRIWRLTRGADQPVKIADVVGPVYYHGTAGDGIVFATTVEKGEGEQDAFGRLYLVDSRDHVKLIEQRRKDIWSARYFGYGVMEFAEGRTDDRRCWLTCKGFRGGLRSELIEPPSNTPHP